MTRTFVVQMRGWSSEAITVALRPGRPWPPSASAAFRTEEHCASEVVALEQLARRSLELHLALLEEDRPDRDLERDLERRLHDDHRLGPGTERGGEPAHALDADRRLPER